MSDPYAHSLDSMRYRMYAEFGMGLRLNRTVLVDERNPWERLGPRGRGPHYYRDPVHGGELFAILAAIPGYLWRRRRGKLRQVRVPDARQYALITGITS